MMMMMMISTVVVLVVELADLRLVEKGIEDLSGGRQRVAMMMIMMAGRGGAGLGGAIHARFFPPVLLGRQVQARGLMGVLVATASFGRVSLVWRWMGLLWWTDVARWVERREGFGLGPGREVLMDHPVGQGRLSRRHVAAS